MKIALMQAAPARDAAAALDALDRAGAKCASGGATLLITPEMWLGGYNIGPASIDALAAQSVAMLRAVSDIATRHQLVIVVGMALPETPRPANAAVVIDSNGNELARYQKTHLFGDLDRCQFSAGAERPRVFSVAGWRVGLAICYDIEFPEHARHLAAHGAEFIATPTANMQEFPSIAERIVPARAEENGVYIAYCNYVGAEGAIAYGGTSCVCDPDGNTQASGSATTAELLFAELHRDDLLRIRQQQDYLSDRRTDLYALTRDD